MLKKTEVPQHLKEAVMKKKLKHIVDELRSSEVSTVRGCVWSAFVIGLVLLSFPSISGVCKLGILVALFVIVLIAGALTRTSPSN